MGGASPVASGKPYTGPFDISDREELVLAIATQDGVQSPIARFNIPKKDAKFRVEPIRPAVWNRTFQKDATSETFAFLEQLANREASLGGLLIDGQKESTYWEFTTDRNSPATVAEIRKVTDLMMTMFPGRSITLKVEVLSFKRGQDLIDLVADLKTELQPNEVIQ